MNQQEEMRLAIEEYLGWKRGHWQEWASTGSITVRNGRIWSQSKATSPDGKICDRTPDFCGSLDAIHEAEELLTNQHREDYYSELFCLLPGDENFGPNFEGGEDVIIPSSFATIHATATQRAEAFCRTLKIGPFKEQPK